jgi:acyl-CoA thioester hydrolase
VTSFECRLRVRSYEMDAFGHVNHAVYLNYLEQARFDALSDGGLPHDEISSRGWGVYVVRVEVDYLRECFHGQELRIVTEVEEFGRASMVIRQSLFREDDGPDADPALTARVVLVWVGADGRPIRVPAEARSALG